MRAPYTLPTLIALLFLTIPIAARAGEPPPSAVEPAGLPASAETAADRLAASPRHGEWVTIPAGESDEVGAWLVYPERSSEAPVVLVVHEIFGVTPWIRAVADQLAAEGFIAIAPDLLSGKGVPEGPDGAPDRDSAVREVRGLDADEVHRRLTAVAAWGRALPAAADRYGIMGFCWGGAVAFEHAVRVPELGASVVYYGTSPATESLDAVQAPVLGLYGEDDARVNATIQPAQEALDTAGRTYQVHIYQGAGHGFLRQQEGREGANLRATEGAWPETLAWLRAHLEE